MSATFAESAERYLCFRRNLGFAIAIEGEQLLRFARYADSSGHTGPLTIELAVQWATQSMKGNHLNHARRLNIVRRFARFLHLTVPIPRSHRKVYSVLLIAGWFPTYTYKRKLRI